ncbi:MAG: GlcNAc-PI de-N-acetylase [Euryarchaeota archaeon]|nr:GlcNAc-PI de-N-acetylase [Euryarchaeota archaeon]|tara:strand:+ start:330 stop:1040 length:711 start_codon:yes stop_codon:yes gene_type:complete
MKILVLVAHPDDEVLGMGGTLKKLSSQKNNIKVAFLATGIFARRSDEYLNDPKYKIDGALTKKMKNQINKLRLDAKKALTILGIKNIEFFEFPDNEMDTISNLEITKTIEKLIQEFKPEIIYTHTKNDINVDHRAIFNATITATRPTTNQKVKKVICFEVPSSSEWNFGDTFSPNIFIDINKELSYKIKAIKAYKNELRKFPHPRSPEALDAIAKRWGSVSGSKAAEAFELVRDLQ